LPGPGRDPQPNRDDVAEARGPRRYVELGAVVVRLREGARHLTEPAVRPPTMYFCKNRKSSTTGTALMTAPAANSPQLVFVWSETHWYMPTASVQFSSDCKMSFASRKSENEPMKESRPTTARIGATSRRMIVQKIWEWLAPSILAASSISLGIVLKNPYMRNVFTPS